MMSDIAPTPMSSAPTPRARGNRGSSARPRGPPSESVAPQSDDEGFADDQLAAGSGRARKSGRPVPRVDDAVGRAVQSTFEEFMEE